MVQEFVPTYRLGLRYGVAIVLGVIFLYYLSLSLPVTDVRGHGLSQHNGTATQEEVELSISTGAQPPSSADGAHLHVVVAHHEEDPVFIRTWLDDLRSVTYVKQHGLHVTIYTKGTMDPARILETTAAQEVIQLPNIGREGGTHLHHILKTYDHPPPFTLFTQAYLKKAQHEGSGETAGHLVDWLIDRLNNRFDRLTGFMSLDRKHDICYCGHCMDMDADFYPLWPQFYTLITGRVCHQDEPTIISFNAHFIVSRQRILNRPKHIYQYLQELVDAPTDHWIHAEKLPGWFEQKKGKSVPSNPKFGHTLERLWHTLFACDNADVVEDCDIEGMQAEGDGGCMCRDVDS